MTTTRAGGETAATQGPGADPVGAGEAGIDPPYDYPGYGSTALRAPKRPLVPLVPGATERTSPVFGHHRAVPQDRDLTRQHAGEPLGERINVSGRLLDGRGRPLRGQLVEIWQANAAGRYAHQVDQHPAPLDPSFSGAGRCLTDDEGRYGFVTIKPGAYPWRNHPNAWRPAHIHFSVFGTAFVSRLVTQMYFPGDPLFELDPIFRSISDEQARWRMVSALDMELTQPEWALGYRFDLVLGGVHAIPLEADGE
ncbi:MAG: protocatechuate 3,4-dioxygenase subunit beta [Acidimicrobiales bacterium]